MTYIDIIIFLTSFSFFLLVFSRTYNSYFLFRRLKNIKVKRDTLKSSESDESLLKRVVLRIANKFRLYSEKEIQKVHHLFELAGWRPNQAMGIYSASKLGFSLLFGLVGYIIIFMTPLFENFSFLIKLFVYFSNLLLGSNLPNFYINHYIKKRQSSIELAFPDALDLFVICAEAGLNLDASLQRVAREIGNLSPYLGYELSHLYIELNVTPDRKATLMHFANRIGISSLKGIFISLSQAEAYGTPIAHTMKVVSEEFRKHRLLRAEEKASKIPALITIPLLALILPCLFIILAGPAVISVLKLFKS